MDKKIACVIMAAGNSVRFGENKLNYIIDNKSLFDVLLDKIPEDKFNKIIVVSQYDNILKKANERNYIAIHNDHPEFGKSYTIRLAMRNTLDYDGVLFLVSDQPKLKKESIINLINTFENNDNKIITLKSSQHFGNPSIFPSVFFNELRSLTEEKGGKSVMSKHENDVITINTEDEELIDIDSKDDLKKIQERK